MRNAVGNTWVFGLVISFTLIFSGFLVLVLSYSKAYKIKNEVSSIIEKYEGLTNDNEPYPNSIKIIGDYMRNSGYDAQGKCNDDEYGLTSSYDSYDSYNSYILENAQTNKDYLACFNLNTEGDYCNVEVTVFYKFNLPVLGSISAFKISGQTNTLNYLYIWDNKQIVEKCN